MEHYSPEESGRKEGMMLNDFAEFTAYLKALSDEEKQTITVNRDEGIVRVLQGDTHIFTADEVNFVYAFFILAGNIDIDENEYTTSR
jgi:hypothetical protein